MSQRQSRRFRKEEKLTMFGRYFRIVCQRLHVNSDQIAQEAGLDPSTISKGIYEGGNRPQYETVEKIVSALMRHKGYLHKYKKGLFNLAHHATPEQYEEAVHDLVYMEYCDEKYGPEQAKRMEQQE